MINKSVNNHYVPQMYLKEWSNDGKIFEYRLLVSHEKVPYWSERSIKRTASIDNLYTTVENGAETDTLEKMFDAKFENPAKKSISKVICAEDLSGDDWKALINYVLAQYVRTPAFYAFSRTVFKNIMDDEIDRIADTYKSFDISEINEWNKNYQLHYRLPISIEITDIKNDSAHTMVKIETIVGKEYWFFAINHVLNKNSPIYKLFHGYKWGIITTDEDSPVPTCDNPFVVAKDLFQASYTKSNWIAGDDKVWLFPLSPHKVLFASRKRKYGWRINANKEMSNRIKELVIKNAFLFAYNYYPDDEITKYRKRLVDENEFKRINKELQNLYHNYINEEVPLLKKNLVF